MPDPPRLSPAEGGGGVLGVGSCTMTMQGRPDFVAFGLKTQKEHKKAQFTFVPSVLPSTFLLCLLLLSHSFSFLFLLFTFFFPVSLRSALITPPVSRALAVHSPCWRTGFTAARLQDQRDTLSVCLFIAFTLNHVFIFSVFASCRKKIRNYDKRAKNFCCNEASSSDTNILVTEKDRKKNTRPLKTFFLYPDTAVLWFCSLHILWDCLSSASALG